jgi:hypothetical protein
MFRLARRQGAKLSPVETQLMRHGATRWGCNSGNDICEVRPGMIDASEHIHVSRRESGAYISAILLGAASNALAPERALAEEELRAADATVVAKGYRGSRLEVRAVWNDKQERIGTIVDLLVYRDLPAAVILEVGGFLGLNAHLVAVPLKSLMLDETGGSIVLPGATRKALADFPEFTFRD